MSQYEITKKLFCVTSDNARNNYTATRNLSKFLLERDGVKWDAQQRHIACLAHVLNLAVKAFLSNLKIMPVDEFEIWRNNLAKPSKPKELSKAAGKKMRWRDGIEAVRMLWKHRRS